MNGKKSQSRRRRDCIGALSGRFLAHRRGTVQKNTDMHLPLVREELDVKPLKTAVKVPVDAADVVSQHVFTVVGKFHRLTVCLDQMFSAEKSRQICP